MRVLQIGPFAPPHGGVHANLSAIREALHERGGSCEVIVITRPDRPVEKEEGVYCPRTAFQLMRLLFKLNYDIIHLHIGGTLTSRLLALAFVCSLLPKKKSVLTFHAGGYPSSPAGQTAKPFSLRGFVFRRLDRIIGVNTAIVEMFKKFGVASNKACLIFPYSFTRPPKDTPIPPELNKFLSSHHPVLISVGGLEPEYDLPLQIDVMEQVIEKFPQAGLMIVGSGSLEKDLHERIKSKPYAEHIMLCGDTERIVTLRMIEEAELMLRTTLHDGDAISIREALFLGTPVIATDNGMRPDGVELIPISDLSALKETIIKCLSNETQKQSCYDNGKENIESVLQLYEELLKFWSAAA
jgi:glycosyltransferase involved in cell wall biosynthesis